MKLKKLFVFGLLLLVIGFLVTGAYADAPNARTATDVNYVNGLAHITTGASLVIDADGRAYVRDMGGHTISAGWGSRLVYTGECVVHEVIVQSQDADAYAAVFNAVSATGTAKADPQSATAKQVNSVDLGGSLFSTGIYLTVGDDADAGGNTFVTVVYDPL